MLRVEIIFGSNGPKCRLFMHSCNIKKNQKNSIPYIRNNASFANPCVWQKNDEQHRKMRWRQDTHGRAAETWQGGRIQLAKETQQNGENTEMKKKTKQQPQQQHIIHEMHRKDKIGRVPWLFSCVLRNNVFVPFSTVHTNTKYCAQWPDYAHINK